MPINFDSPQTLFQPATKLDIISYHVSDTDIRVKLNWIDTNGNIVQTGTINIVGADYTDVMTNKIEVGMVDKKISKIMRRGIMQKIKSMLNIAGTVQE